MAPTMTRYALSMTLIVACEESESLDDVAATVYEALDAFRKIPLAVVESELASPVFVEGVEPHEDGASTL